MQIPALVNSQNNGAIYVTIYCKYASIKKCKMTIQDNLFIYSSESLICLLIIQINTSTGTSFACFACQIIVRGWTYKVVVEALIVVRGIPIHPDLSNSNRIFLHHVNATPPLIWASFPENVSNVWAQNYFQHASTHPYLVVTNGNNSTLFQEPVIDHSKQSQQQLEAHPVRFLTNFVVRLLSPSYLQHNINRCTYM